MPGIFVVYRIYGSIFRSPKHWRKYGGASLGYRLLKILIVVFWIVMMSKLAVRQITAEPALFGGTDEVLRDMGPEEGQEWSGIYLVGPTEKRSKIGFAVSEQTDTENGHVMTSKSWLRLKVQGEVKTIRTETKVLSDNDYRLQNLSFVFSSDTIKFEVLGDMVGTDLHLQIKTAAGETEQVVPMEEAPVLPETLMARAVAEGLEEGKTFNVPVFDPTSFSYADSKVVVTKKQVNESGKVFWLLSTNYKGFTSETWIDETGSVHWQKAANFLTVRETKLEALSVGSGAQSSDEDLLDQVKVKVDKAIRNPRRTSRTELKLLGIDYEGFKLEGGRQRFDPDTGIVTIESETIDPADGAQIASLAGSFPEELKPTAMIQSTDPIIVREARRIVMTETDSIAASKRIFRWVYENLEKKPMVSIPSARDVLEIKRGDCNEHASLYTALGRAVGIPTKIVVGVVYQNEAFYYHAWNAIWTGNRWVELDATFGQYPADATHLRLLEGDLDKQIPILRVIGKLNIEVLSAQ
jgi:Transglutaminase-like superfamily